MINKMQKLIDFLNYHTKLYDEGKSEISDKEWDNKFFELVKLEEESGIHLKDSPTLKVNWEVVSSLTKVQHNHPMLSLAKTKDKDEFINYFTNIDSGKDVIAMLKLDGLTCSLRYVDGHLVSAETRGNGEIGEDITHNIRVNPSVPLYISYREELVIDGEIICTEQNFQPYDEKNGGNYKNPRNFAAGKIRSLDCKDSCPNALTFVAWNVVKGFEDTNSFSKKLDRLTELGFCVTPYICSFDCDWENFLKNKAKTYGYPIDGLVGRFDDIDFGNQLGSTGHHPKAAYAYKFYDEEYETRLKYIEWSMGRTGILTPVAIFEPIDIDGTEVERASLHNYSVMKDIMGDCCYCGQKIKVFKANMIIPQIKSALKMSYEDVVSNGGITCDGFSNDYGLTCPICKESTSIVESESGVLNVVCDNPQCEGKLINRITHFFGKQGLDAKGFSRATIQKVIDWGYVENVSDCFRLDEYRTDWIKRPGFGEKSVTSILTALDGCRNTSLNKVITAAGIPLIGSTVGKSLAKRFKTYDKFRAATREIDFSTLDGFGYEMNSALHKFDYTELDYIVENFLTIEVEEAETVSSASLEGLTFCITGRLSRKRDDIKADIEAKGGKVTGSVSSKTNYLVCNDKNSNTGKSKDAKTLGIPIITEEELKQMF